MQTSESDMIDQNTWYTDENATFGDRLTEARDRTGLSQEEVAERLGVELDTIAAWEDDLREPRANRMTMLAGMYGVSLSWLMTGKGEGPDLLEEGDGIARDVTAILSEMRGLRGEIAQAGERLARLEKRLRKTLSEAQNDPA